MRRGLARVLAALVVCALLALLASEARAATGELRPADAPWIGPEKHLTVPPLPLEYHTDRDAGVVLAYPPWPGERVRPLAARLAAIRAELSAELGRDVLDQVEIRVAAAPSEMARLAPPSPIPSDAMAVAFRQVHLVVMSASATGSLAPPELELWLRHALAHLALDEALGDQPVPRWFHEGYAWHFAGADALPRAELLTLASLQRRLFDLSELEARAAAEPAHREERALAAAEAADFARFLSAPPNRERFADLLAKLRSGESCVESSPCPRPFDAAVAAVYGESMGQVELGFRKELARRYGFLPVFVATSLLWMLVAALMIVRRRRGLHAQPSPDRSRRAEFSRRAVPVGKLGRKSAVNDGSLRGHSSDLPHAGPASVSLEGGAGAPGVDPQSARVIRELVEAAERVVDDAASLDPEVPRVEHDGRWYTLH